MLLPLALRAPGCRAMTSASAPRHSSASGSPTHTSAPATATPRPRACPRRRRLSVTSAVEQCRQVRTLALDRCSRRTRGCRRHPSHFRPRPSVMPLHSLYRPTCPHQTRSRPPSLDEWYTPYGHSVPSRGALPRRRDPFEAAEAHPSAHPVRTSPARGASPLQERIEPAPAARGALRTRGVLGRAATAVAPAAPTTTFVARQPLDWLV